MSNEKKNKTISDLKEWGYSEQPDGTWAKSDHAMGRLETGKHAQQTGALEREASTPCKRKVSCSGGGRKRNTPSNRQKRPYKLIVTMTAYLPRYFDDDNLSGALKPVRDEIAKWLGIDDGDRRVLWEVDQTMTRGKPGVCVAIRRADIPT